MSFLFALLSAAALTPLGQADDPEPLGEPTLVEAGRHWFDLRSLQIEGLPEGERAHPYDRLPARAETMVRPPVWSLSHDSAGIVARFHSDSTAIDVRWTLRKAKLAMTHMPATGVSGVDLYVRQDGKWRWVHNAKPQGIENSANLVRGLSGTTREYMLYLPLYNGVDTVMLGLDAGCRVLRPAARSKPIVFYGTSITQGACASRPGMAHVAILGRRLDCPVVNFGFSGNGKLETPFVEFLGEIDAAVYVLDCLPNLNGAEVRARTVPFVRALRARRPTTPILLVEDRSYADADFQPDRRQRNQSNRESLRACYQELQDSGVGGLVYLEGAGLLGSDGEGTVDGSHPTDLGFMRQADAFERALRPLLPRR